MKILDGEALDNLIRASSNRQSHLEAGKGRK